MGKKLSKPKNAEIKKEPKNEIKFEQKNSIKEKESKEEKKDEKKTDNSNKKVDKIMYSNFKTFLDNIYYPDKADLPKAESINNNELCKIIDKYQITEKNLYYKNKDIIYNYFLCKNEKEFLSKQFLEENQEITNEFRYFKLFLFFGFREDNIGNFYSKIFLNICKMIYISSINDLSQKVSLQKLRTLKDDNEWIFIIPCFEFPFLLKELMTNPHVNSFLIHCHGKHSHNEKYFQNYNKYKGTFYNHKELVNLLQNINTPYICPKFNYNLGKKDKFNKFDFYLDSNIQSKITTPFRNIYENAYFSIDQIIPSYNEPIQLLYRIYLYYNNVYEGKKDLENKEQIKCFYIFFQENDKLFLEQKYNLCIEFIPKLFLVIYYYLSYFYSNPFKLSQEKLKKLISKAQKNNDKYKLYFSVREIINDCYKKIINNESILSEKIINTFHELLIQIIIIEVGNLNIYQYKEALSDFDFCLELIFDIIDDQGGNELIEKLVNLINDKRFMSIFL